MKTRKTSQAVDDDLHCFRRREVTNSITKLTAQCPHDCFCALRVPVLSQSVKAPLFGVV
jgi:hypothetical protein